MRTQRRNYRQRGYIFFNVSELSLVNWTEVLETPDSLRYSLNGEKTFVKWDSGYPKFIKNLTTADGPYTYDQALVILDSPEWTASQTEDPPLIEL